MPAAAAAGRYPAVVAPEVGVHTSAVATDAANTLPAAANSLADITFCDLQTGKMQNLHSACPSPPFDMLGLLFLLLSSSDIS